MRTLGQESLPALARGFSLLGSGGGGATTMLELMVQDAPIWPIVLREPDAFDPATPCVAVAFAGSTYLLTERLPAADAFGPLLAAAERWTGVRASAVCGLEGAGMNGLSPLLLADRLDLVDADLMGRALPRLDQISLLVDAVPGVVAVCDTGGGVVVIDTARPADVESQVRAAIVQAGGAGAVLVAGFTVGDLLEHGVVGTAGRALRLGLGSADRTLAPSALAEAIDARLLATGRVSGVQASVEDPYVSAIQLDGDDGALLRLVARSELLAVVRDGVTTAASPEIIVALDSVSGDVLQVDEITLARNVIVLALAAPAWWTASPDRERHITPAGFGLRGLEVHA